MLRNSKGQFMSNEKSGACKCTGGDSCNGECKKEKKTEVAEYGYFSKKLNKAFDTLDELKTAEADAIKAEEEKKLASDERKKEAEAIVEAYKKYQTDKKQYYADLNTHRQECINAIEAAKEEEKRKNTESRAVVDESQKAWRDKFNAFIEKYGSYHMTYTNKNGEEVFDIVPTEEATNDFGDLYDVVKDMFKFPFPRLRL